MNRQSFPSGRSSVTQASTICAQSVVSRPFLKLSFKSFHPYEVLKCIRAASYKLDLLDHSLIHPVFHVSQLKPFIHVLLRHQNWRIWVLKMCTLRRSWTSVWSRRAARHATSLHQVDFSTWRLCHMGGLLRHQAKVSCGSFLWSSKLQSREV
jgi:hypothetical protein